MPRHRRTIDEIGAMARRIYAEQIAPERVAQRDAELRDEPEPSSYPRGRPLLMARRIRPLNREDDPNNQRTPSGQLGRKIYHWPIVGGTEVAGMHAKYTVILWSTGELSCDCPGWIHYFRQKGDTACKHAKARDETRNVIFQMWQHGENLPQQSQGHDAGVVVQNEVNPEGTRTGRISSRTANVSNKPKQLKDSGLILGRVIDV